MKLAAASPQRDSDRTGEKRIIIELDGASLALTDIDAVAWPRH